LAMVFLVFPKDFERNQFLLALNDAYKITFFENLNSKISNSFLIRFGAKEVQQERKDVLTDPDSVEEKKGNKQYFAILSCLETSDVAFTYELIALIKEIQKHDSSPAIILVGTAGGPEYLRAARIQHAIKFDRGEMLSTTNFLLDTSLEVPEQFPGIFSGATTYCSNFLMHFQREGHFLDMESFEFCKVCKYMDIKDYACVRICSDVPQASKTLVDQTARNFLPPEDFKKYADWEWSLNSVIEAKQLKIAQKVLRKLVNFSTAINQIFEIIEEYTIARILTIPSNNYESHSQKKKCKIILFKDK